MAVSSLQFGARTLAESNMSSIGHGQVTKVGVKNFISSTAHKACCMAGRRRSNQPLAATTGIITAATTLHCRSHVRIVVMEHLFRLRLENVYSAQYAASGFTTTFSDATIAA
jgi:hypothetical protein